MLHVRPSEVVTHIDRVFGWVRGNQQPSISADHTPEIAGIVALVNAVPPHLLLAQAARYVEFVASLEQLRSWLPVWQVRGSSITFNGQPLRVVRDVLAECPDEFPAPTTHTLTFIGDATLRESLRLDIEHVGRVLAYARARDVYDVLVDGDVRAVLPHCPQAFDLIVAADVFPFVRSLDDVLPLVANALRPGGSAIFTVDEGETLDPAGVVPVGGGRYLHTALHVERAVMAADLWPKMSRVYLRCGPGGSDPIPGIVTITFDGQIKPSATCWRSKTESPSRFEMSRESIVLSEFQTYDRWWAGGNDVAGQCRKAVGQWSRVLTG